jgi:SPP1 gp7 family putative phage head morphogenesis protein
LTPPRDLGDDFAHALYRAGVQVGGVRKSARGFVLLFPMQGRFVRLDVASIETARQVATKEATIASPVVMAKAVGQGTSTVYERLEVITLQAHADVITKETKIVTPSGRALAATVDVYDDADLRAIAHRLSGQLRGVERSLMEPRIVEMLGRLDVNWDALSASEIDRVWKRANQYMRGMAIGDVLPQWEGKVAGTMTIVSRATRQRIRDEYLPRVGVGLQREETAALNRVSTQQGWFLRDRSGHISDRLTQQGRRIVAEGLQQGLGRNAIGRELRNQLPELATKWGRNYANVVAANAVSRARSFAEITSYREAGIMAFEAQAVLDERTTEYCRFIDGQIVDVQGAYDLMQQAANVRNPEDIYRASPFMTTVQTRTGPEIRTTTGTRLAQVIRSGVGNVNDRGQFKAIRMGRGLPAVKIGMPPYHHL